MYTEDDAGEVVWDFGDGQRAVRAGDPVLRFRIELPLRDDSLPIDEARRTVTRLIEVPAHYSFWDLHVAIQSAMGWLDSHLHEFCIPRSGNQGDLRIGLVTEDHDEDELVDGQVTMLSEHLAKIRKAAGILYRYDWGDNWKHTLTYEATVASDGGLYPRCLAGRWACPPEDCGGDSGYFRLIATLEDRTDPDHKEAKAWLRGAVSPRGGWPYKPEKFDPRKVKFDDPDERAAYMNEPH